MSRKDTPIPRRRQHTATRREVNKRVAFSSEVNATEHLRRMYRRGWSRLKWIPRRVCHSDTAEADRLLEETDPTTVTQRRVPDFVEKFMTMNDFTNLEDACRPMFIQMLRDGLSAGTAAGYMKIAADVFGGTGPIFTRVIKVLQLLDANEDPKHAPDRDAVTCNKTIEKMRKRAPLSAAICELILKSGLRCKDISRLPSKRIRTNGALRIRVRRAKNIRDQSESVVTRIPFWFGSLSNDLTMILKKHATPFKDYTTSQVLQDIRRVDADITTYTFRRCFMHRALVECNFDFDNCVRKYSLHKQVKTLRAYYDTLDIG